MSYAGCGHIMLGHGRCSATLDTYVPPPTDEGGCSEGELVVAGVAATVAGERWAAGCEMPMHRL